MHEQAFEFLRGAMPRRKRIRAYRLLLCTGGLSAGFGDRTKHVAHAVVDNVYSVARYAIPICDVLLALLRDSPHPRRHTREGSIEAIEVCACYRGNVLGNVDETQIVNDRDGRNGAFGRDVCVQC